jgi:HK97 family phage major capsid protein
MTALKEHLEKASAELKSLVSLQETEIKKHGQVTEKTAQSVDALDKRLSSIMQDVEEKAARIQELEKKMARPDFSQDREVKTIGSIFTSSSAYKKAQERGLNSVDSVEIERKDITSAAASAGGLIDNYRNPEIYKNPDRPMYVRELLNKQPVSDSAVEIMRELVFTNEAGPQFDNDATPKNQLVSKKKSNITFEKVVVPVRTIAHYIIASRQVLADAPRLRNYIDGRLVSGLQLEMDAQVLYGDGLTENFTGLFTDAAISDVGEIATGTTADKLPGAMIDHIRKAITECQKFNYTNVNGLIVSPEDWAAIETAKGSDGHYIWASVVMGGEQKIWRVPVIVTNALVTGDFILGDWRMGATLYERESISVRASESHAELFVKNGVAILGEERACLGIELPKAFCKGSFIVEGS